MGQSNSTTVKNIIDVSTETVLNAVTNVQNKCKLEQSAIQDMTIKVDNSDLIGKCLEVSANDPSACSFLQLKNINIEDINQTLSSKITGECEFDNDVATEIQAEIANQMKQKMDSESDSFGKAMTDMVNVLNNTNNDTVNEQTIKTLVETNIDTNFLNEMMMEIQSQQKMLIDVGGNVDSLSFKSLSQNIATEAFMKTASKNQNLVKAATSVKNETDQDLKRKEKGLTDIVDSFTTMFSSPWVIAGLACCFLVFVVAALMAFNKKTNAAVQMNPMSKI